ncbi:ras-related protein Rab-17-like [Mauremys reevesii]|uniref:ras-related protein Rab-17-like n=1 Tax=Mauremys reevesii TaxID=260615 RepID=UPI00193F1BEF|nr:ras-related protein Rab-17-like [Mauremys reevesii]XP_039373570.1 ras-related protein Rab-17-like [Mauremys reevesii]
MAPRRTQQVGAGPSTEQAYISKVVLLGSAAVGKSSTAFRRVKNDVRESVPTVGYKIHRRRQVAGKLGLMRERSQISWMEKYCKKNFEKMQEILLPNQSPTQKMAYELEETMEQKKISSKLIL